MSDSAKFKDTFHKKYLQEEMVTKRFLKSIAYEVQLNQIVDPKLKEHYGGNFMLQIYDKTCENIFERILQYDIVCWNIFYDYFFFKLDPREKDSDWIYIVYFKQEYGVVKIKDISIDDSSFKNMGIQKQFFYYANAKEIKIIELKVTPPKGGQIEYSPQTQQYATYVINQPCKILNIFENSFSRDGDYLMMGIETDDNQIDFTRLYFWSKDLTKLDVEFYQYREVVKRNDVRDDPIIKFKHVIQKNEIQFGIALRQSGSVDLYWNFTLTNSPEERFQDIEINFKALFIKRFTSERDKDGNDLGKMLSISLEHEQRLGIDVSEVVNFRVSKWKEIFYDIIRYQVKIFTKINLVNTSFFVAYNKVVSIFDIVKKEWKIHFFFPSDVIELLRNQKKTKHNELNVGAYLENGDIRMIDPADASSETWVLSDKIHKIEGKLEMIVSDWRDMASHYILTRISQGKTKITGFQKDQVIDLNGATQFKEGDELIRFISTDLQEDFVILSKSEKIIKTFTNQAQDKDGQMNVQLKRRFKFNEPEKVNEKLHTMVATKNEEQVLLIGDKDLFKLRVENGTITILKDMMIQSLQVIDDEYVYSLSNESEIQKSSGFYIQNANQFLEKQGKDASNFKLKGAIVGCNDLLDYYKEDQRIAYMSNYDSIKIVPVLHRCAIGFIGMRERKKYLAFKKQKDKLIALDKKGTLTTWSIQTGKILEHNTLHKSADNSSYSIFAWEKNDITYKASWYQPRVLLVDHNHPVDINQAEYFGDRLTCSLQNNVSYVKIEEKKFLRYKVIEIINSQEIEEHFSFVHPNYGEGRYQRMFFSDDLQFMLERIQNQRVFFYKREETLIPGEIRWVLIRRLKQFPQDLSECTNANFLFSPNLQYYLDYDKDDNMFVIKTTFDQQNHRLIPQGLMNPSKEKVKLIAKKFKWVDNSKIRIMNIEGFEKTVDINDNFKEISYCSVPMVDAHYLKDENMPGHFYYDVSITEEHKTKERLQRKFQEYYEAYYSDNLRSPFDLYEVLFKVDYNIDNCNGKLVADLSFSYFHWKLAEMMRDQPKFNIKRYQAKDLELLALNIFPYGNTVLHYAHKQLYIIRRFYKVMEQEYKRKLESAEDHESVMPFQIPFVRNFEGKTAIHMCLQNQNFKSADIILQKLCNSPIDSHSRQISDILPDLVEAELPILGVYLDSRIKQTDQLKDFRRGAIKYQNGLDYAVNTVELWPDSDHIQKKFFMQSNIDSEVVLELLDVPSVHCYQEKVSEQFFEALADCKKIDIFKHKSIQAIIDHKWPLAKEQTIKLLFLPFLFYHLLFIIYSNVFNGQTEQTDSALVGDRVISAFLYLMSIYFLQNEIRQIYMSGLDYLSSIWNYADIIPPIFIIVIVSIHLKLQQGNFSIINFDTVDDVPEDDGHVSISHKGGVDLAALACIHAIASLLMWAKLLYFLRIFKQTGYLIRMLTEVISSMRVFLVVLCIVMIAFGEAFLRFSEMSGEDSFILNYADAFVYTLRLAIGDTQTDTFNNTVQPTLLWILFSICLILTNVVMLNLLIAIISEAFEIINQNSEQANYQERARIIAENSYLIPKWKKKSFGGKNQYLVMARELQDQEIQDPQVEIQNKLLEVSDDLHKLKKEQQTQNEEVINTLKEIRSRLPAVVQAAK
ncbi:wd-40 repeat protein [Stylonychia lemnae]|uniref:Wd-40 repeat protein n=1 Tax=Stylonychia lemnae TaxID=5949 RepID=A0A078A8B2_STYLE|nr:wd-40 repeat protein [Stylonychia lemnae]|eukprot:CDW78106.1 wd-40 repeat protein [Stylonychia lemnae]